MADDIEKIDWSEKFKHLSQERREKMLVRAARLAADSTANPNERDMSVRQLQAALEVDSALVLDVIASVRGGGTSNADLEKSKRVATEAQSNFTGLVNATQTLRASLTELGLIAKDARLPETVEQWNDAVGKIVKRETRLLATREEQLIQQQGELEKKCQEFEIRQKEALDKIEAAGELWRARYGKRKTNRWVARIDGMLKKVVENRKEINDLSFRFDRRSPYEVGRLVKGKGVYVGIWEPKDREGNFLDLKYHVFSAPNDLTDSSNRKALLTFKAAARELAAKKNWCHHNGLVVPDHAVGSGYEAFLYDALRNDTYSGEWFIPPRELLHGKDMDGNQTVTVNLYALKDSGDFKGTFTTASGSDIAHWYWSSTEHRDDSDYVWDVDFTAGDGDWDHKDNHRLSCRPCRVELAL